MLKDACNKESYEEIPDLAKISASPVLLCGGAATHICLACGFLAARATAKFCQVCGHNLSEECEPLDALKASYNLHKQEIKAFLNLPADEIKLIFGDNKNTAASTAMAFVVYSLVPYVGILFCPGALLLGGVGLAISFSKPSLGGRQTAIRSLLLGALTFAVQILLWWLLYIVPELGGRI